LRVIPKRRRLALLLGIAVVVALMSAGAAQSRPNVLIIVTDDQRVGLARMPETRTWFQAGGMRFRHARVVLKRADHAALEMRHEAMTMYPIEQRGD
jgi:hypothetical protein